MALNLALNTKCTLSALKGNSACVSRPSAKAWKLGGIRAPTQSIDRSIPTRWRCQASKDSDGEQATLQQQYTFHTPGSVQEPTAGEDTSEVVFAHQTPEEAGKWSGTQITHVGDTITNDAPKRIAIVIGEFHNVLMDQCLEDARLAAEAMGATVKKVVWVPGTYEAPLVTENLLQEADVDCVVVVGYIEKGSTLHGQEMGSTCSLLFKQLELKYGKPVGMGIIGPGATAEQAATRVAYAGNATRAAIRLCHYLDTIAN
ncbi:hypothetical protein CYMTET_20390 [Cymbomonas tetramitiformis]|uniref:6,7-dimethyl-8-ribityllumazine synthase n=1 Tax=Cymbomonas tetramitiformis TaxID=36881 RepID=A0AAE0G455_9CHLO|nr:hypothetical protein CYMTET_20390 [Cymbomonas tetramitiformis]